MAAIYTTQRSGSAGIYAPLFSSAELTGAAAGTGVVVGSGDVSVTVVPGPGPITAAVAAIGAIVGVGAASGVVRDPSAVVPAQRTLVVMPDDWVQLRATVRQPLPVAAGARIDVAWDFTRWIPAGDSLAGYQLGSAVGMSVDDQWSAGAVVSAWLRIAADVQAGQAIVVPCDFVTTQGRAERRSFALVGAAL